jgi:hypothetical protein
LCVFNLHGQSLWLKWARALLTSQNVYKTAIQLSLHHLQEILVKKFLIVLLMTLSATAMAHGRGGYWARGHGGAWHWMVPTIIGGAIVYEVARQQPVIVQQPVVVQSPQPVVVQPQAPSCSPWTETQNPDGTITRTRTCTQ